MCGIGLRPTLYAGLTVTHIAAEAAVCGSWRYISAFAFTGPIEGLSSWWLSDGSFPNIQQQRPGVAAIRVERVERLCFAVDRCSTNVVWTQKRVSRSIRDLTTATAAPGAQVAREGASRRSRHWELFGHANANMNKLE